MCKDEVGASNVLPLCCGPGDFGSNEKVSEVELGWDPTAKDEEEEEEDLLMEPSGPVWVAVAVLGDVATCVIDETGGECNEDWLS